MAESTSPKPKAPRRARPAAATPDERRDYNLASWIRLNSTNWQKTSCKRLFPVQCWIGKAFHPCEEKNWLRSQTISRSISKRRRRTDTDSSCVESSRSNVWIQGQLPKATLSKRL